MIFIAGGGTGGHVYPALAIADALVASGRAKSSIHFVGSARALEASVVPEAGYSITLLAGRGIKRRLALSNITAIAGLFAAFVRALALVARRRPEAVVSVGGYAAAPAAFAAVALRVPLIVAESNAVPGAVNRIVAKRAAACAVAWPGTPLPNAVITGNPVRPDIVESRLSRDIARAMLGVPTDRLLIASFGGSLGATAINNAMVALAEHWRDRDDLSLYHVVGKRDWAKHKTFEAKLFYKAVEYEENMVALYAAADLLICRSGATTSAEIAVAGVPSILVPFPNATGDHQTANARAFEKAGAAIVLPDKDCDGEHLALLVGPILVDPARRAAMSAAARSLAVPDAAARVAKLVNQHARPS